MMSKIKNGIYQNKADKLVYYEKLVKLLKECEKLGFFVNASEKSADSMTLESDVLYCYLDKGAVVNGRVMAESYYLFVGNTCVIYNSDGFDEIIRIKVKEPDDQWILNISNYGEPDDRHHIHILSKNIDIYANWDVDWMGYGKRDRETMSRPGSWWKYVYDDVSGIYEFVAKKSVEYRFDEKYRNAAPTDRKTYVIDIPLKVTVK